MKKWKDNLITLAGTLGVTLLLSLFLTSDISLFAFMSALNVGNDFKISDFYNRFADDMTPRTDKNIAIVDIGSCNRMQIAKIIEDVESCNPAVIGLDVLFLEKSDSITDKKLADAINSCKNIVIATSIEMDGTTGNFRRSNMFSDSITAIGNYGCINLEARYSTGVVREFRNAYATDNGDLPTFPTLIVKKANTEKYAAHTAREHESETIFYPMQAFSIYTPADVAAVGESLKGKIVIIGDLSDGNDLHRTPISEEYYGTKIHAATIATILNGNYVREIPATGSWIIAILTCTAILLLKLALQSKKYGAFVVRICQILLIGLSVFAGCHIFARLHIVIDINKIVLMLLLGILSMDIWTGAYGIVSDRLKRRKSIK